MGLIYCCRFSWGESQSAPHSFYPAGLSRAKYILLCVSEVWQTKRNIVPVLFPSAGRYYLRGEMRGLQRALQEMSHCSPLSKVWFTAPSRNTSIQPHCGICLILIHIYLSNLFFFLLSFRSVFIWHFKRAGLKVCCENWREPPQICGVQNDNPTFSLFRLEMRTQRGDWLPNWKSSMLTEPLLSASLELKRWSTCSWWSENHPIISSRKLSNSGLLQVLSMETFNNV